MANTYKNIVITPNRTTAANVVPTIQFSGGDATTNTDINLKVYTTSNGTLSFEGSAGQLFSITNDLSNVIFSVNDVSGIPSIEVDANGEILLAPYSGRVLIGTTTHKTTQAYSGATLQVYDAGPFVDNFQSQLYDKNIGVIGPSHQYPALDIIGYGGANTTTANSQIMFPEIRINRNRGTFESPANTVNGDTISAINFRGYSTVFNAYTGAQIAAIQTANISGTYPPIALTFSPNDGTTPYGTERMRIDASGNVGIGTTAPYNKLTIVDGDMSLVRFTGGQVRLAVDSIQDGYAPARVTLARLGASTTPTPNDTEIGGLFFYGLAANSVYTEPAYIQVVSGTNANGGMPAYMGFGTASSGATAVERMRIDSNGSIGIGDTNPNAFYTKNDNRIISIASPNGTSIGYIDSFDTGTYGGFYIEGRRSGTLNGYLNIEDSITYIYTAGLKPLTFGTNENERMRIDASGNVLINRTDSTVGLGVKLDVNGGINAASVLVNGAPIESGITTGKAIAMAIVFG